VLIYISYFTLNITAFDIIQIIDDEVSYLYL